MFSKIEWVGFANLAKIFNMASVRNLAFLSFLVGFLVVFSCKADKQSLTDNILDIRLPKEPEKLNPIFFPNSLAREVCQNIFLPLADFDPVTLELVPVLIKDIPEAIEITTGVHKGGVRYDFVILEEAKWDDNKPITGYDYLFTLKAVMHPGTSASAFRSIASKFSDIEVDSLNPKKVSVYFDQYFIIAKEAALNVEVLPKHIYDPSGILDKFKFSDFKNEQEAEKMATSDSSLVKFAKDVNGLRFTKEIVVGSGPYKLGEWKAGEYIVLEKKPNYWAKNKAGFSFQQHADKIIMHIIPDETAAFARLRNGELDILSGVSSSNFEALKKDSSDGFNFQTPRLSKYYNIIINHNNVILASLPVRKALAHLTNVNAFITNFENGKAVRTIGPVNPDKKYYNKEIVPYTFDIDAAKKLLADDGWKDSDGDGILDKVINGKKTDLRISLIYSGDLGKNLSLQMQADTKKAGIALDIEFKEFAQVRKENLETGKFNLVLNSSIQDVTNDDFSLRFHSENAELGEGNFGFYKNKDADQLIDAINQERNDAKRNELYKKFQVVVHQTLPYIFLYSPSERILISNRWQGSTNAKRPGYQANTFVATGK